MKRLYLFAVATTAIILLLGLGHGCDEKQEIVMTPEGTFTPSYLKGREIARQYADKALPDYAVVWNLYDTRTNLRGDFLDGFEAELSETDNATNAATCRQVLQEAVTGNQFENAKDLGAKHAAHALTNEQIQGTIHSSVGVSKGVSLGWKAGYIKGYASQRIADTAAAAAVDETRIKALHAEAAAAYHALRAAIGP